MKKNTMMRVASALLVAVLLTTCAISGTFAKYVTSASGSDQARVAKWGFGTSTIEIDMFDGEYNNVDSKDDTNVVAPGTTKTTEIRLVPVDQGTTEVAYSFDVNISAVGTDLLNKLVWKLNGTKCGTNGTFAELQADLNTLYDKNYDPNTLPAETFTIAWEWPFETGNDESDTNLGLDGTVTLQVVLTFTATQLD